MKNLTNNMRVNRAHPTATIYTKGYMGIHRSWDTSPEALILPE
jgi:hypothetical protein